MQLKDYVEYEKDILKKKVETFLPEKPKLGSIIVGEREDSKIYNRIKKTVITNASMDFENVQFNDGVSIKKIVEKIKEFSSRDDINGILVQLPLNREFYSKEDEEYIINNIPPLKDVDGLTDVNQALLFKGFDNNKFLQPCTPLGIVEYLKTVTDLEGKNITVVGRSQLLGNSLAQMLMRANSTVTILHTKSESLKTHLYTNKCDILCLCAGQKDLLSVDNIPVTHNMSFIIDAGINRDETGLCGDFKKSDYDRLTYDRQIEITKVPGGVGTLTTLTLAKNLYKAFILQKM